MPDSTVRLAVLIDADNASPAGIADILTEVATFGVARVKRLYGDFTSPELNGWRKVLAEHAIQPIQQFRNTTGKNASDSALIIDAMDLLHTRDLGGFCLVSSDSDFTRLATRIRENGIPVYGFGEQKTPRSFIQACDRFIYTEIFRAQNTATAIDGSKNTTRVTTVPLKNFTDDKEFKEVLEQSIDSILREENGRANLSKIGDQIYKILPDFDPRNYGFKQLSEVLSQLPTITLSREQRPGAPPIVYVQRKEI
jgi:hypothetical protein